MLVVKSAIYVRAQYIRAISTISHSVIQIRVPG